MKGESYNARTRREFEEKFGPIAEHLTKEKMNERNKLELSGLCEHENRLIRVWANHRILEDLDPTIERNRHPLEELILGAVLHLGNIDKSLDDISQKVWGEI